MKALSKILQIIVWFFAAMVVLALIWCGIELAHGATVPPLIDFVLYLLGFGDMDSPDHYLQTAFSALGLFAVTLLSSVFTVSLFDLRRKVRIAPHITILSKHSAQVQLTAAHKNIYDLTATLIAKCGQDVSVAEQRYPFIAKNTALAVDLAIHPGTPLYKYLRVIHREPHAAPQLILTISYTDIDSGQTYMMAHQYDYRNTKNGFVFADPTLEEKVRAHTLEGTFPLDLSSVFPCVAEDIDIAYGIADENGTVDKGRGFTADIHLNSRDGYLPSDFTMAVTKDLLGNNWLEYREMGCALRFDYRVEGDIAVTMELKCGPRNEVRKVYKMYPSDGWLTYTLPLQSLREEDAAEISELCFTAFYKDADPHRPVGRFTVRDGALEL